LPRPFVQSELRTGTLKALLGSFDIEGAERTVWMLIPEVRYMHTFSSGG
jgi:hypothetical protein